MVDSAIAAGRVESLSGTVEAIAPSGAVRKLSRDAPISSGEEIRVSANARVSLRFDDATRMELGPRSRAVLDNINYVEADAEKDSFATRILNGTFRVVTGLIGKRKPRQVAVSTVVATIGVRGTHFAGEVDGEAQSAKVILLAQEDTNAPNAVEVKNDFGSVVIDQPGYGTEIPDAQSPPSPVRKMELRTIQNLLRVMRSSHRISAPRIPR
jgi:hypothetical protein